MFSALEVSHVMRSINARYLLTYLHSCGGPWQVGDTHRWQAEPFVVRGRRTSDDEVFMTRSINVTPKKTEQNLIARSGKSEAAVIKYTALESRYCTVEVR